MFNLLVGFLDDADDVAFVHQPLGDPCTTTYTRYDTGDPFINIYQGSTYYEGILCLLV